LKPRLAPAVEHEAIALCIDLDGLSIGQPRVSKSVDKDKGERVILEQDIEDRAADAQGAGRRFDLIAAGLLDAGDKAEGTLGRIKNDFAGAPRRIEYVFIERNLRSGADAQGRLIPEKKLRVAVLAGAHKLIGKQVASDG